MDRDEDFGGRSGSHAGMVFNKVSTAWKVEQG